MQQYVNEQSYKVDRSRHRAMLALICSCVCVYLMNLSPIFTFPLVLLSNWLTREGNIQLLLNALHYIPQQVSNICLSADWCLKGSEEHVFAGNSCLMHQWCWLESKHQNCVPENQNNELKETKIGYSRVETCLRVLLNTHTVFISSIIIYKHIWVSLHIMLR